MAWLVRDAEVLASVERCSRIDRGGAGPAVVHRPILLRRRYGGLDVAWCRPAPPEPGSAGSARSVVRVVRTRSGARRLPAAPAWPAPVVIVADRGAFERWHLDVGDRLEITCD